MSSGNGTEPQKHHPATATAWSWFEKNAPDMSYDRRERIFLALADMDATLWKFDHRENESDD